MRKGGRQNFIMRSKKSARGFHSEAAGAFSFLLCGFEHSPEVISFGTFRPMCLWGAWSASAVRGRSSR